MDTHALKESIEQQLIEVEMVEAMFPGKEEFQMDDETIKEDVNKWMLASTKSSNADFIPPRISFKLCLLFGELDENHSKKGIEANVLLPHGYPSADVPEIYVKSYKDSINRIRQSELNDALSKYIKENMILGEVCLTSVISWLQENGPKYILLSREDQQITSYCNASTKCTKPKNDSFIRFWIYSHHIYSKIKRRDILDLSREFQLTGFCMPGKPGIICMEGSENNCSEAWSVIKSWNWKKIHIKHQETGDFHNEAGVKLEDIERFRRFTGFEEIGFVKNSDTRDYHMDMGEFSKYLEKYQSLYMFKALFGFDKAT